LKAQKLGIILVALGVLIIMHHTYVTGGRPFDIQDIFHHEFFEAIFITAGLVLLISSYFDKNS
jgi:hypothetical protein